MQLEEVIAQAIEEGKSLTTNEREKAAGPYDAVYLGEKIRYHARRVFYARLLVVLLYVDAVLAVVFAFSYDALAEASRLWFKWLLVVIAVLAVCGLPWLAVNHGRNAALLRLIRSIRESQKSL